MRKFIKFGNPNSNWTLMVRKKMADLKIKKGERYCAIPNMPGEEAEAISLLTLKTGQKGIVLRIEGGRGACKRLNELGIIPGTEIKLVNKIQYGPVMITVKGSKLALGRGLAAKVFIKRKK